MKSFSIMTADEIKNYKGPMWNYSLVLGYRNENGALARVPFDGNCTSAEERDQRVKGIIEHYGRRGWGVVSAPRYSESMKA